MKKASERVVGGFPRVFRNINPPRAVVFQNAKPVTPRPKGGLKP